NGCGSLRYKRCISWLAAFMTAICCASEANVIMVDLTQQGRPEGSSMSEDVNAPVRAHRPSVIRNPQDFYGGLALVALSLFAFWASGDLPGMRGFSFGPGTAPRLFAGVLLTFGVVITATGLLTDGKPLERYAIRGPFWITVSIFVFATT